MSQCADDGDMYKAATAPVDKPPHQGAWQAKENPEETFRQAAEALHREEAEAAAENVAAGAGPTGEQVTPGDQRSARAASKFITGLINDAQEGIARRVLAARDAINMANGLNVGDVSNWLTITNKLYKYFVDDRADFHKWVMGFAQDPVLQPYQQQLIKQFNQLPNKIRAKNSVYERRRNALLGTLRQIAKRTNYDAETIADALGHYAVLEHIPEANAELLARWRDQLKTEKDEKEQAKIQRRINDLEAALEDAKKPKNLKSAGYTNAEARTEMAKILAKYKVTKEEAEAFTTRLRQEFDFLLQERVKAGAVTRETLAAFPTFEKYVPLYSRAENLSAPVNDASYYNPGKYYELGGMLGRPDSAWQSLLYNARRTATELGMQDFATTFAAVAKVHENSGLYKKSGLRVRSYEELQHRKRSKNYDKADEAQSILNSGGIVVDMPVTDKNGVTHLERQYVYFKNGWEGLHMTGKDLNMALSGNYKIGSTLVDWLGRASSWHGQLFTRFNPGFAPIGGFRDGMERIFHLINRTYYDENGKTVTGSSLVPDFLKNSYRSGKMFYEWMAGKAAEGSDAARYGNEFQQEGLFQHFVSSVRLERSSLREMLDSEPKGIDAFMDKHDARWMSGWLRQIGGAGKEVVRRLDAYNDYLQNLAAFNQYVTMRKHGISQSHAAQGVLEMMNFQQHGTLTPALRVVAPFVVPTMQSTAAVGRTLGFGGRTPGDIIRQGRNGWLGVLGGGLAFGILYEMARDALGEDAQGRSYFDAMPITTVARFLPIAISDKGDYVKFPIGYGPVSISAALAVAGDRVYRGLIDPTDAAVDVMFTVGRDFIPTNIPQYKFTTKPAQYIAQLVMPDVVKPLLEVATNTNYFGNEIARAVYEGESRASAGKTTTDVFWHNVARKMLRDTGLDMAPEQYQYLAKSYFVGPMRLLGAAMDTAFDLTGDYVKKGELSPSAEDVMGPWLSAIGGNMWYGRVRGPGQSMYFAYKDEVENKIKRLGIKMTDSSNAGKPPEVVEAWRRQQLEESGEFTPQEIDDYILMRRVGNGLRKLTADFSRQHKDTWMRMESPEELRTVFEEMFTTANEYYDQFYNESNYYAGQR